MKAWLGIDPGTVGAWALIDNDGHYSATDISDPFLLLDELLSLRSGYDVVLCAVERGQAMPKQGVSSMFRYGVACGKIEGILMALGFPYTTIRPSVWMQGLPKGKDAHLQAARARFPSAPLSRAKDHHRAEALLLAEWARRIERGA